MKAKTVSVVLGILCFLAVGTAHAQVQMITVDVPSVVSSPLNGFQINYTMSGSKFGIGAASAEIEFYASSTRDGSGGVVLLDSFQITLNGSGFGPYTPPFGTQNHFISRFSMDPAGRAFLEGLCETDTWFILGRVDFTAVASDSTQLGATASTDLFFTGGSLSPSVIQPGGTTNISFDVRVDTCPANAPSTVGIFLADANFQLLAFIGGVGVGAGVGTYSLPPTGITFSSSIPPDEYNIVLIADVDGVVAESDESNNAAGFGLDIVPSLQAAAAAAYDAPMLDLALPADMASEIGRAMAEGARRFATTF